MYCVVVLEVEKVRREEREKPEGLLGNKRDILCQKIMPKRLITYIKTQSDH